LTQHQGFSAFTQRLSNQIDLTLFHQVLEILFFTLTSSYNASAKPDKLIRVFQVQEKANIAFPQFSEWGYE